MATPEARSSSPLGFNAELAGRGDLQSGAAFEKTSDERRMRVGLDRIVNVEVRGQGSPEPMPRGVDDISRVDEQRRAELRRQPIDPDASDDEMAVRDRVIARDDVLGDAHAIPCRWRSAG